MVARRSERFLTTVLFTDIVGSTEMAAELGDRAWRDLVQQHHALVRAALRRYRGREIDTAGDSFFAVFDAPASAVDCALDLTSGVHGLGLQIRTGVHVGEVEQIGGKVGGISVPIASRIMAAAGPDETLVSGTVRDLAAGSGLQFADRGPHELKGVPGEWQLYAASRVAPPVADVVASAVAVRESERAQRRAAAVRRSRSRPIWQRRPRLFVVGVALLVVVIVGAGLLAVSPWRVPALPGIAENSIGVIDPGRNEIVRQTTVGAQPASIAAGPEGVWVTNTGSDTVSRLDPATHAVVDTIDVGRDPEGIAVGAGSIWVADSGERSVTRINAATGRVVDSIAVGNGPRGVALAGRAIWVTNWADGTITRIDATTGQASPPISVAAVPTAITGDDTGIWVVSEDGGTVTHLDATSGIALAPPIPVGLRPSAVAIGNGAVWVANSGDGSVSRIDPITNRVTAVHDVGGVPVGLALTGPTLWVADRLGKIARIDLATPSVSAIQIGTTSAAEAVAAVNGEIWFASRASTASHRGGTLRVVSHDKPGIDPTGGGYPEFQKLIGDGLIGFRHAGGIAASELVPDLATAIPRPSDGGLTYTFLLRRGLVYADGTPVRAADIRYGIQRAFQVADPVFGSSGPQYLQSIKGTEACVTTPVARCDLSEGIVVDDAANSITFHLAQPDPDFIYKLTVPAAFAVPGSLPPGQMQSGAWPGTGPYVIASTGPNQVRLTRNPNFHSWDPLVRPDGFPDDVVWTHGVEAEKQVEMVEAGTADYMADQIPAAAFSRLRTQFTPQLHQALQKTTYMFLNTKKPPFDNLDVRRALALAIDRAQIAVLRGGPGAAVPTCQVLPPNFRGYEPYCPFTLNPGPAGRWTAPDLETAKQLVASSGTAGMKVVVGPFVPRLTPVGAYVTQVLRELGYDATQEVATQGDQVFDAIFNQKRVSIGGFEWIADYPAPDTFLGGFTCTSGDSMTNYCDPKLDALINDARTLQGTDAAAASKKWAEVDRAVVDLALWVPFVNEGSSFVSARVGNYQYNTGVGIVLDQVWVQ